MNKNQTLVVCAIIAGAASVLASWKQEAPSSSSIIPGTPTAPTTAISNSNNVSIGDQHLAPGSISVGKGTVNANKFYINVSPTNNANADAANKKLLELVTRANNTRNKDELEQIAKDAIYQADAISHEDSITGQQRGEISSNFKSLAAKMRLENGEIDSAKDLLGAALEDNPENDTALTMGQSLGVSSSGQTKPAPASPLAPTLAPLAPTLNAVQ